MGLYKYFRLTANSPPSARLSTLASVARSTIADRRLAGVPVHRVHGDLHLGNILFRDGLLRVLDFDDMVIGPAVQDLWLALPGRDSYTAALREKFLEGYIQFRDFDRSTLSLIEILRGMRVIHYAAWIARRWHDPAFPAAFPTTADIFKTIYTYAWFVGVAIAAVVYGAMMKGHRVPALATPRHS